MTRLLQWIAMHVFLLGADAQRSRGIAIAKRLSADGHSVTALTWFDTKVRERGQGPVDYIKGDLTDATILRRFEKADAVIDTTFPNLHTEGTMDPLPPSKIRLRVLRRLLAGSGKPLVVTSDFTVLGNTTRTPVTERAPAKPLPNFAWLAELERDILRAKDIRGVVIRHAIEFGSILTYGIPNLVSLALRRKRGTYIDAGANRWSVVHYEDLADLYCLAAINARSGLLLHAAAETFTQRELADAIHRGCGFRGEPSSISFEEAQRLTPVAKALRRNHSMSGDAARALGWHPSRPSLLEQIHDDLICYRDRPHRSPD
jgi:nucleoside-diphosphate-sugar epimerase